ncbi:NAD(P)-dependent oxidoreductase [Microbulbifer taiwanensis]|uniref:Saccharopine dehydrogenase n=1 Tax=Microbulbifer taiwanensis TaxID=986746 RepID=A0ABW1YIE2_9GAMM|nr:NAD(P)-dependent oxidoreductase [Microbulbifer taiwanensis]
MSIDSILLIGGSGFAGGWATKQIRDAYPDQHLLIGARDMERAQTMADVLGRAEAVAIDLSEEDLGLGDLPISAVAVFFADPSVAALRFAQSRCVPYLNIAPALFELGPEMAAYMHRPDTSAVVLGTEWMVGATTIFALRFAEAFDLIEEVRIGAILDEKDDFGPSAMTDYNRQTDVMTAALARKEGAFFWRMGDDRETVIHAADGTATNAVAASYNDVLALSTALHVQNLQFDLAIDVSSSRRRGERPSTEILIEIAGTDRAGAAMRTRHAVISPGGQMPLTGLGAALVLERLTGLDGNPATPSGLYFPYQLLNPETFFARFEQIGGIVQEFPA